MSTHKFVRVASPTTNIENQALRDLPTALTWLERVRPDIANLLDTTPVQGVAATNGASTSASLRQVARNPAAYRVSDPATWQRSLQRLGQGIKRLAGGSAALWGIGELIEAFHVVESVAEHAPTAILATQAYQQMGTPTPQKTQSAMQALQNDPAMANSTTHEVPLSSAVNLAWSGSQMALPASYVTTPNVYAADPLVGDKSDDLSKLVMSPNGYRFDGTGYIVPPM